MGLKVWGWETVASVQKVLWCAGELDFDFEFLELCGDFPEPRETVYLDGKNTGSPPVIDDSGFILWEGNAIVRYPARNYGAAPFWPSDPQVRADADHWMDYQLSTVRVHVHPLMWENLDTEQVAHHSRKLAETKLVLERALEKNDYLTDGDFTVGDIPLGIVTYRWFILDIDRPDMPNVEAWYGRIRRRSAFQKNIFPPPDAFTSLRTAT